MIIYFPIVGKVGCVWCIKCMLQLSCPNEVRWDSATAKETIQPDPDQRLHQGFPDDLEDVQDYKDYVYICHCEVYT